MPDSICLVLLSGMRFSISTIVVALKVIILGGPPLCRNTMNTMVTTTSAVTVVGRFARSKLNTGCGSLTVLD